MMGDIHVLSVNWSASYIRGVLINEGIKSVVANDIDPSDGSINPLPATSDDIAPEDWPRAFAVGSDKLSALRYFHQQQQRAKPKMPVGIICSGSF